MSIEIERKFLLKTFPDEFRRYPRIQILQGYFLSPNTNEECRVREIEYSNHLGIREKKYYLTKKTIGTISREETEIEITKNTFKIFWEFTENRRIKKDRYSYSILNGGNPLFWEIDVFHGALDGLILAEIEIPSVDFEVDIPKIIQDVLIREVTNEDFYKNRNLADTNKNIILYL